MEKIIEVPARILDEYSVCPLRAFYILNGIQYRSTTLLEEMKKDEKEMISIIDKIKPPDNVIIKPLSHDDISYISIFTNDGVVTLGMLPDLVLILYTKQGLKYGICEFTRTAIEDFNSIKHIYPRLLLYAFSFYKCKNIISIPILCTFSMSSKINAIIPIDEFNYIFPHLRVLKRRIINILRLSEGIPRHHQHEQCYYCSFKNICFGGTL